MIANPITIANVITAITVYNIILDHILFTIVSWYTITISLSIEININTNTELTVIDASLCFMRFPLFILIKHKLTCSACRLAASHISLREAVRVLCFTKTNVLVL